MFQSCLPFSFEVREYDDVRGLQVGGIETKLSLYDGDTAQFLKDDVKTLKRMLDIFLLFRVMSGLA